MKISEVSIEYAKDYCGVSDAGESGTIKLCMEAAKAFVLGFTGLDAEAAEPHEDLTAAYLVLTNEMYTNRDYTVERAAENPFVKRILALHSVNYL